MFAAHSGFRYLVLLAGLAALAYLAYGRFTGRPFDRAARVVTAVFTGCLDLQIVLGLLTLSERDAYPALAGHIVMMILAAVAAHGLSVAGRRSADPARRYTFTLAGVALALVLVAAGISAIGRGVFQSTVG